MNQLDILSVSIHFYTFTFALCVRMDFVCPFLFHFIDHTSDYVWCRYIGQNMNVYYNLQLISYVCLNQQQTSSESKQKITTTTPKQFRPRTHTYLVLNLYWFEFVATIFILLFGPFTNISNSLSLSLSIALVKWMANACMNEFWTCGKHIHFQVYTVPSLVNCFIFSFTLFAQHLVWQREEISKKNGSYPVWHARNDSFIVRYVKSC